MNFVRRAWKYLNQNKIKKCIVGMMFICISLLYWGTRSMKIELNKAIDNLTNAITADVTIYRENGGMTSYDENATFPYQCVEEIIEMEDPKSVSLIAEVNCFGEDVVGIIPDYELSQKDSDSFYVSEAEKKTGPLNLIGVEKVMDHESFRQGKYDIVDGRGIEENDKGKPYAVVSGRFLMRNKLELGDTFTVSSCFNREKKITLKIIGVHSGDFVGTKSWESDCNYIYTPLKNVYALNNNKVLRMQMELIDAKNLDKRIQRIEETGQKYNVRFRILKDNMEYLNVINPIESMKNTCDRSLEAVLLVAASILSVINIFEIAKRKREMGILISLGERRWKIALQFLAEQLIPVLSGIIIGTFIWIISDLHVLTLIGLEDLIVNEIEYTYRFCDLAILLGDGIVISVIIVVFGIIGSLVVKVREMLQV